MHKIFSIQTIFWFKCLVNSDRIMSLTAEPALVVTKVGLEV